VTGVIDTPTIAAIKDIQTRHKKINPGAIVDGRMSPAKGGYNYGGGDWVITRLNDKVQNENKVHWPRIDKTDGCPEELEVMVVRTLVGTRRCFSRGAREGSGDPGSFSNFSDSRISLSRREPARVWEGGGEEAPRRQTPQPLPLSVVMSCSL
jgi:hypothetical protein